MMNVVSIKMIAGVFLIIGITIGGISLYLEPDHLILESSKPRPAWLPWAGWIIASIASVLYVIVDYISLT